MGYKLSFVFLYLVWPIETKSVIRTVTCGKGKTICSNDMCGAGATPVISNNNNCFRSNSPVISNANKRFRRNSPGCGSSNPPMCIPFLDDFCYIFVTIYGSDCSALYDQVFGISLDFCCQCNSVFKTCKCNCCKCLNGAGGTCGQSNCDRFNCPS